MIPEFGFFALILALMLAVIQSSAVFIGLKTNKSSYVNLTFSAALGQFVFMLIAFIILVVAFVTDDFSVAYVAQHSNSQLPIPYKVSAVWGGHEGSMLLWTFILSVWGIAVTLLNRSLPRLSAARVVAVMGMISIGFIAFLIFTSNPFDRILPNFPLDGQDLNPLLQDIGLIIHPPMLYMGYVGFSVAFSIAIAALLEGRLDSTWIRWARPWTLMAWVFLTLGIMLGSWWAYYELGWGGWWFWDPVENASFMPWLTGTALVHSLAVTEKRGVFKSWTLLLAILTFSLCLLGTFLVRSGVLTSVHAFASDPTRGVFILGFLALVVGSSLLLFAVKAHRMVTTGNFQLVSRESFLLLNNILLAVATVVVLLGTLFPLIADVLQLGKISVGAPYFNMLFVPLFIILLIFLAPSPVVRWKKFEINQIIRSSIPVFVASFVVAAVINWIFSNEMSLSIVMVSTLVFWVVLNLFKDILVKVKFKLSLNSLLKLSSSYRGMVLAHIGVAMTVFGIAYTSTYSIERDVKMNPGESLTVAQYQFEFARTEPLKGVNYRGTQGVFNVTKNNQLVTTLRPEKRIYNVRNQPMTEAAIDAALSRDLYVALGEPLKNGAWAVRVYVKPFIRFIWLGGVFMALGGFMVMMDRRYRLLKKQHAGSQVADGGVVTS
ncbi:MAG: heme lyase CcmF/NrfE family subunit [Methylococcales bacterium]|jgi:cytochrome c-type biogenesis protein CcmF|nr:heme lyase CcmF/NrfE family subunit [Methylococcales bacterium]MBT7408625.1 heme lyase CcmF/NrfE family subunit [Methylococcales bacterium]